jgi:hypothetical protein
MSVKQFAALIGFLFVVVWIRFNFGDAVLCLVGAAVFWIAVQVLFGELNLAVLQGRFGEGMRRSPPPSPPGSRVR